MAQDSWTVEQEDSTLPPSPPHAPPPCSNNCGFFGSSTTMNLCSSCYRNLLTSKPSASAAFSVSVSASASASASASGGSFGVSSCGVDLSSLSRPASPTSASTSPAVVLPDASPQVSLVSQVQQKQPPRRCFACRKRVGLTGFKCRCGDVFCSLHRYSDKHSCSFDYKAAARVAISKANPVVKADKIDKI